MYLLLKSLNNTEGNGIDGVLPQAPGQLTAGGGDSEPAAQFVENATEALEGINPQTNDQAPAQIPGNPTVMLLITQKLLLKKQPKLLELGSIKAKGKINESSRTRTKKRIK